MADTAPVEAPKESKDARKKRLLEKKFAKALKAISVLGKVKGLKENQVSYIVDLLQKAVGEVSMKLSAKAEKVSEVAPAIPV